MATPPHPDDGLALRDDLQERSRAVFFRDNPDVDRLFSIVTALMAEVAVLRLRLDTHERLAARSGAFSSAEVEAFQPDAAALAQRLGLEKELIARVLHTLLAEIDGLRDDVALRRRLVEGTDP